MSRRALLTLVAASALALSGCAHPLVVDPAPYAADPDCAEVMLAVPTAVGGLEMRGTTSQATQAWGSEYEIVARCGVEPPGPTTERCVTVETPAASVDWLVSETADARVAVTFGRSPALELTVPTVRADEAVGDVLAELSPAAARAPSNGLECS
ncbi:DUF3515 family protein [Demequina activiva]|uniref:DUF3515 domain-containing protein n=1 Tax=Demequina activiva TaxID=1582364 RepID=A0A919Q3Y2_9MICO|nr:DUF3515 family protein [Demequina activiva]GIG55124.1 hypothetical protein Dac01nite_18760 [Demequina activiva]